MPICSVEPSSTSSAIELADGAPRSSVSGPGTCSCSGRSVAMKASSRSTGTTVLPCVRGIRALISAMSSVAVSAAARAASTEVPSVQKPWRSGGESCSSAASSVTWPDRKSPGMSDRKIGTKSARPSSIAARSGAPVKSETDRNWPALSASANGAGPAVCR